MPARAASLPCESVDCGPRLGRGHVLVLVVAVLLCRLLAVQSCPVYDDAFITFRYARNLVAGLGMQFNPGAPWEPVLGTTTPGYTVLLAGLGFAGVPIISASLAVNFLADAISVVLIVRLLKRAFLPSVIAALAFATMPSILRITAGGMEAPVFACLGLAAVVLAYERRPALAGLLTALCCTIRPEAVILVIVLGVLQLSSRRALLRYALPVLLVGAAYSLILWSVFGSPISQSVIAKAANHTTVVAYARFYEILREAFAPQWIEVVLLPLVLMGLWQCIRRDCPARAFGAFALLMVAAYLAVRPKTWGWYYYVPLTAWTIWLGMGVGLLSQRLAPGLAAEGSRLWRRGPVVLGAVAVLAIGAVSRFTPDAVTREVYEPLREWAQEVTAAAAEQDRKVRIMASDIGAIGWFADAEILDSMGLVWPPATEEYASQVEAIRDQHPEYVMLVANDRRIVPFMEDPLLRERYRPIRRFNVNGETDLQPDPEGLPHPWVQDYIIYERVYGGSW